MIRKLLDTVFSPVAQCAFYFMHSNSLLVKCFYFLAVFEICLICLFNITGASSYIVSNEQMLVFLTIGLVFITTAIFLSNISALMSNELM